MSVSGEMQEKCPDQEIYCPSTAKSIKLSRTGYKIHTARSNAIKYPERDIWFKTCLKHSLMVSVSGHFQTRSS